MIETVKIKKRTIVEFGFLCVVFGIMFLTYSLYFVSNYLGNHANFQSEQHQLQSLIFHNHVNIFFISGSSLVVLGLTISVLEIRKDKVTKFVENFKTKLPSFEKRKVVKNAITLITISLVFQAMFFAILYDTFTNPSHHYSWFPEQQIILRGIFPLLLIFSIPMLAIGITSLLLGLSKISSRRFFYILWFFTISFVVIFIELITPQRCGHCF